METKGTERISDLDSESWRLRGRLTTVTVIHVPGLQLVAAS